MDRYLAYEASAGSGKTFALVVRYISLLYLGAKPNTILTLTFTNKAANEMRERINLVLKELNTPKRVTELGEISKETGLSTDMIIQKKDQIYQNFLQSDLKISTIDKFFSLILRKFSLNLALMPDFQIEEQMDEERFVENFLKRVKESDSYKDLVTFAVKESKKLGSIFTFLENLYAKDGELKKITPNPVTKSNEKKILELADRIREIFLSCNKLSNSGKKALNFEDIEDLLQKSWILKESLVEYSYFRRCFTPYCDEIFFELKDEIRAYFANKNNYLLERYLKLYKIYKDSKRSENISQNRLGFNDVTNSVFELLRENIESDFLYFRLDSKIDHILIDEFQDTNVLQYKILEPILDEIRSGMGVKEFKTLFYVGDIKQSIYRFRGGAKELFHHVAKNYDVTLKALTTNYRSRANIVKFVNESFKDKIENYKDQQFIGDENQGFVKVTQDEDLLQSITDSVFELIDHGADISDIAILTFTNDDAFLIEEALLKRDKNLKITTQTTSKLINDPTVSAIIELLKYIYFDKQLYKINFLTAIGHSWDSDIDLDKFDKNSELLTLVKQIIENFQLYSDNPAIFKFLETLGSFKDIEEFLFESEELNIDSPAKKDQGIKILTIHKSKGLEFEHLIVCDRFKKKNPDRSSLIYEYDDIELKRVHVRIKNRDYFDKEYKEALQTEKRLSYEDALNLLYVAFTRAKESLYICQNEQNSSFDILMLEKMQIGQLFIEKKERKQKEKKELIYQKQILGQQEKPPKKERDEREDFEAIYFGTALHYMLEILESFDKQHIQEAYWAMKNRYEIYLEPNRCEEIKKRVERLINHEPFLKISRGRVFKEQPISFGGELKQIDLLIEQDERWIVIDYKSSESKRSEHVAQVTHYKEAISKITDKQVLAYLCYVRSSDIELISI